MQLNYLTKPLNQNRMADVLLKGIRFHELDGDNEIEIERDGWSSWISISEAERLIKFLKKQIEKSKQKSINDE